MAQKRFRFFRKKCFCGKEGSGVMIFKRKLYDKMLEWKREFDGKTALLIKGARRVGKSTLVEEFAKNEYESYILIDFSIASKEVKELFHDLSDLNFLFLRLLLLFLPLFFVHLIRFSLFEWFVFHFQSIQLIDYHNPLFFQA